MAKQGRIRTAVFSGLWMQRLRPLNQLERQHRYVALALTGGSLLTLLARRSGLHLPWQCPFRRVTGIPCPTCGLTRSLTACLGGQWSQGFSEHVFGPPLLILALLWLVGWVLELQRNRPLAWMAWLWPQQTSKLIGFTVVLLGYHAVRLGTWWQTGQLQGRWGLPW